MQVYLALHPICKCSSCTVAALSAHIIQQKLSPWFSNTKILCAGQEMKSTFFPLFLWIFFLVDFKVGGGVYCGCALTDFGNLFPLNTHEKGTKDQFLKI